MLSCAIDSNTVVTNEDFPKNSTVKKIVSALKFGTGVILTNISLSQTNGL